MKKLRMKSCIDRFSFVFTWGGKGLFRNGAVDLHITAVSSESEYLSLEPRELEVLPESERPEALRALIRYFSGPRPICITERLAWLPPDLADLVVERVEEVEMEQVPQHDSLK
jgi:hypothetical protein